MNQGLKTWFEDLVSETEKKAKKWILFKSFKNECIPDNTLSLDFWSSEL